MTEWELDEAHEPPPLPPRAVGVLDEPPDEPEARGSHRFPAQGHLAAHVAVWVTVLACVVVGLLLNRGPAPLPEGASPTEYSALRAMEHVEAIAKVPHPIGSAEDMEVVRYIVEKLESLDLELELEETTVVSGGRWPRVMAATVHNVLARIPGTDNTKALLLMAHHDSVPNARGAADDASGVATILETARAVRAGPKLANDIILLFTGGEEPGLFGARAFVREHPWASDVGLVLNFEGRGSHGPVLMFETSPGNGGLIREMAKGAPHVVAHGFMFEAYKRMPNSTDFTVFRQAGYRGLNFAFVDGFMRYHSASDTPDNLDPRTLQHMGSYALSLARHFGDLDLAAPSEELDAAREELDAIYFSPVGTFFIHYPGIWAVPSALLLLALFWAVAEAARFRGHASLRGITAGMGVFALAAALSATSVFFITRELVERQQAYAHYMNNIYLLAFVFLTTALFAIVYLIALPRAGLLNLSLGAIAWWVACAIVASILVPAGSALFVWAPLSCLLGLLHPAMAAEPGKVTTPRTLLFCFFALPALIIFPPVIRLFQSAMTVEMSFGSVIFVALVLGLLLPLFFVVMSSRKWILPAGGIVFSAAILAGAFYVEGYTGYAGYTAERPRRNLLVYALNADTGKAIWASSDQETDEWTERFFPTAPAPSSMAEFFPREGGSWMRAAAPDADLPAPSIEVLSDDVADGKRWLHLRVQSHRQAPILSLYAQEGTVVYAADIDGHGMLGGARGQFLGLSGEQPTSALAGYEGDPNWSLHYWGVPPGGIDVWLWVKPDSPAATLKVVDQSYGLPFLADFPIEARPSHIIPQPKGGVVFSDATIVAKTFSL